MEDTIEGKPGSWIKIRHQAQSGYVFTNFLALGEHVVQATDINRDYRLLMPGFHCLFMSDKNNPDKPIKKVADHVDCNCLS